MPTLPADWLILWLYDSPVRTLANDCLRRIRDIMMDRYFKYLSLAGARPTLTGSTLRWSRPSRFNDLFDMAVPYSTDFDVDCVTQRALDLMWERVQYSGQRPPMNQMGALLEHFAPHFLRLGREQFDKDLRLGIGETLAKLPGHMEVFGKEIVGHLKMIKVLCLSGAHDDNTMWALYADNHRGLVLEFADADGVDSVYRVAKPVNYSDRAPPILDDEGLANFLAGNITLTPDLADPLMFLKSAHWRYEQELRIVTGEGRNPYAEFEDVPFHPRELVAVYFGARAAELRTELEPVVVEKYPHAQRWQASQGKEFQIDFTRLDKVSA